MQVFAIGIYRFFEVLKTVDKPAVGAFEGCFGVYIDKARIVDQCKQQVAKLILGAVLIVAVVEFVFQFGNFFFYFFIFFSVF